MRHLTAAQHGEHGGWHYVSMSRRGGYPIGYCRDHGTHPTEGEARDCYGQFLRDRVELDGELGSWSDCSVGDCPNPTKRAAVLRTSEGSIAPLCDDHLTSEDAYRALGVVGPAGDAWVS